MATKVGALEGQVRFHHLMPGVWVLEARSCSHQWVVFHETYSFCLALRFHRFERVEWKYHHRVYVVDPQHVTMCMQPGELHANLKPTPPSDFIVVQIAESLMKRVAEDLGWSFPQLNICHPNPGEGHPALREALYRFREDLCSTLFASGPGGGHCTCAASSLHADNLSELVRAFIEHSAEGARAVVLPDRAPALINRAVEYLVAHHDVLYNLAHLARAAGCADNPFYLLQVFRRQVGVCPGEFQRRILVAKTCHVLASSPTKPLEIVAQEVGWPGQKHGAAKANTMIKHFRKAMGVTPDRFRAGLKRLSPSAWRAFESLGPRLGAARSVTNRNLV